MIRRVCDICGEFIETAHQVYEFRSGKLRVRLERAIDGTWNGGDACLACLLRAIDFGAVTTRDNGQVLEPLRSHGRLSGSEHS